MLWTESWRNIHQPKPCAIRVGFTAEGRGPFTVGVNWAPEANLAEMTTWTKFGLEDRADGTESLRWARPLELFRPVLSYEELGRLFDGGPSALYDALAKILGLEALTDAEKWLGSQLKSMKSARDRADDERKRLLHVLAESTDERAARAVALLKKRGADLDEVLALVSGADDSALQIVPSLRALTRLDVPTLEEIEENATRLRAASEAAADSSNHLAESTLQRVELLQAALRFQEHAGDADCPVCGQGRVDAEWAERTRAAVASSEESLNEYRSAADELKRARSISEAVIERTDSIGEMPGVDLPVITTFNAAVAAAKQVPGDDIALADHLESALVAVAAAADTLRAQAGEALKLREDLWSPIAAQLGGWVSLETNARELDGIVKTITAAKKWVADHAADFRNLRLKPIAAQARKIWGQLRQESNVDLGEITLEGTATRRRVTLGGSVDGEPTKALAVMSQGEQHALALALFLPRATAASSPFRFVVLDDPIQAMDPAKIDGFVQVLSEVAKTHQVIVFSHDDRLASIIRETGVDARLLLVIREAGSKVEVKDNVNPALRGVDDVFAVVSDKKLPDDIRARILPGLFRIALESAAKQTYFTKQAIAGCPRSESEEMWASVKKTGPRLALAVHGDPGADLTPWLEKKPEHKSAFGLSNAVHRDATGVGKREARNLKATVKAILELR